MSGAKDKAAVTEPKPEKKKRSPRVEDPIVVAARQVRDSKDRIQALRARKKRIEEEIEEIDVELEGEVSMLHDSEKRLRDAMETPAK